MAFCTKWIWAIVATAWFVLTLPSSINEGISGWSDLFDSAVDCYCGMILYQWLAPLGTVSGIAAIAAWFLYYHPPQLIKHWFLKSRHRAASSEWSGIDDLRKCQRALVEYQSVPAQRIDSAAEIAASAKLRPHLKRALRVLDQQDISYPDFDTNAMVINDTLKWSNFLSTLLACCDDLEGAREAARDFCETHD